MRIQKYLSQNKILSRRETEDYIRKGLIVCNGVIVRELGYQINSVKDKIEILAPVKSEINKKITVAAYKPRGVVCSRNKAEGKTIFEIFPEFDGLNAVGRLDKESEGLILLSNDGVVTSAITGADHKIEKEYEVLTREALTPGKIKKIRQGIKLNDGMTLPAKAKLLDSHIFRIILKEGKKHQIRRMAAALHLTVLNLKRFRIGDILLKELVPGACRILSKEEIDKLKLAK